MGDSSLNKSIFISWEKAKSSIESKVEKDYLTFIWYLIHVGLRHLVSRIESASRLILEQ